MSVLMTVSDYLGLDKEKFEKTGAFDSMVQMDTRLFVDPFLLESSSADEMKNGRQKVLNHFSNVLTLLKNSDNEADAFWRAADRELRFGEVAGFNFGYSKNVGASGSGLGDKFRKQIMETANALVKKGVTDPILFDLIGLFEENVGCDRISDMICRILYKDFIAYTNRILKDFQIDKRVPRKSFFDYELPVNTFTNAPIILVPKDVLRDLPIAEEWEDISYVCLTNALLRQKMNSLLGNDWKDRLKGYKKKEIKSLFINNPDLLLEIISSYKKSEPVKYDFENDPSGEAKWISISQQATSQYPLALSQPKDDVEELHKLALKICEKFKELIETNGHWEFLYRDNNLPKHEKAAQLLFYGISSMYCEANNIALAREPNAGRGPVDFKLANGSKNVLVEIKLSKNSRLSHCYETQLPLYMESEKSVKGIMLVVIVHEKLKSLELLKKRRFDDINSGASPPLIFEVNGLPQESASKA